MGTEKGTVLVVDDNEINLKVVSNFLKGQGYIIYLSSCTHDAQKVLDSSMIDLILLDVMMPLEDGFTFCRRIKQMESYKEIPVIFLTARNDVDDIVEGFQAGGVDYITKPFRKEELLARVKSQIELAGVKKELIAQAKVLQQVNETKDRLYSVVSHDIKAPFASISMLISLLDEGYLVPNSDEFREIISSLRYSTREAYFLLENLLQWTRAQTGTLVSFPETLPLSDIVQSGVELASLSAGQKNQIINLDIDKNLLVYADEQMARCIIRNLIFNAVKFTPDFGQIFIQGIAGDEYSTLIIRDTGIGMEQEQINSLNNGKGKSGVYRGRDERRTGLGLYLVYDFMKRINARMQVQSEDGIGTTFTLQFPVGKQEQMGTLSMEDVNE